MRRGRANEQDRQPPSPPPGEESLLPVLRALVECHTQVNRVASRDIEARGLTQSQFDVIVTLGDMSGMTCKALGERTLITKGTLSPVLDRLEAKGLIERAPCVRDKRQIVVSLTTAGQTLYEKTFLPHVNALQPRFAVLSPDEQAQLIHLLGKLAGGFA